ncbi:NRAMP family divalent metal transporter [Novosphingobium sediminicola]|uniref:NRAMP (Natural resistance-associated macrophage protein)-like metal ion transporter n=1 Tax=Novosphingobium sediminicola TaxID=563162 RepID=A0A7W6CIV2_9SPHN|nr:divalent metal cation transporter [Novosphingobium sediminicola]MBB3956657.1 NRAMP (natural resistance-associated macrophage protein)-like metal ion transporter [Novosphingobium sediminicola]
MSKTKLTDRLGPGLITGAADDDPSGIATYAIAGAQFGTSLLWTMLFTYPLMVSVQLVCARVGRVTGHGLSHSLGAVLPRWGMAAILLLLFCANTINIGADLSAMGEAAAMIAGQGRHAFTIGFAVLSLVLQLFVPYDRYARLLKWMTLTLLAYVALLFIVRVDWGAALHNLLVPRISGPGALTAIVAIMGTTISPYLFFWQASQEVEEIRQVEERKPLRRARNQAADAFARIRIDTWSGMAVSNLIALAIMLGTAVPLHNAGKTQINSAADAARALQPVAGDLAFAVFALGIVGTGLLAIPVLAGASAYAICEATGRKASLQDTPQHARAFYLIIALGMVLGMAMDWLGLNAMKALFWSAVINGIVAVPVLAALMHIVSRPAIMGSFVAPRLLRIAGWVTTGTMALAVLAMPFSPG